MLKVLSNFSFNRRGGFTLVEIMIVVAIIALFAAIAVPGILRARKRSQASTVLNDLRHIDSAMDQYVLETGKKYGDAIGEGDWKRYLKKDSHLYTTGADIFDQPYGVQTADFVPKVAQSTYDSLSDVASNDFWSPFNP